MAKEPTTKLDTVYSSPGAEAAPWSKGRDVLEKAGTYWISTVRPDGRPHVTPLIGIWLDDALYFFTGPDERKGRNLAQNPHCIITTGANSFTEGFDVVVEAEAVQVSDEAKLHRIAAACLTKYDWRFEVRDGAFYDEDTRAVVYELTPETAFGFGKGEPFSQTRWRF